MISEMKLCWKRCYRAMDRGLTFEMATLHGRGNFAQLMIMAKSLTEGWRGYFEREANAICESLSSKSNQRPRHSVVIKPTTGHRLVIRFRHNNLKLSDNIGNTDPAYDKISGIGVARMSSFQDTIEASMPRDDLDTSKISAQLINNFSDQVIGILKNDAVNEEREYAGKKAINCVLLRDAGNRIPKLEPIGMKYGMRYQLWLIACRNGIANMLQMKVCLLVSG